MSRAVAGDSDLVKKVTHFRRHDALELEPYGIMMHKDDAAFKKVADDAMTAVYKSGEINKIYAKWFTSPVPPKGINYNVPMSAQFKNLIANPTSSGDPTVYK